MSRYKESLVESFVEELRQGIRIQADVSHLWDLAHTDVYARVSESVLIDFTWVIRNIEHRDHRARLRQQWCNQTLK